MIRPEELENRQILAVEHEEKRRTCDGDRPTQRDESEKYADDPEFQRDACGPEREEDDDEAEA